MTGHYGPNVYLPLAEAAVCQERNEDRRTGSAQSSISSSLASHKSRVWSGEWKRSGGSSRRKQDGGRGGTVEYREGDFRTAPARRSESSDSVSPRKKDAKVSSSSMFPPMAVVEAIGQSTSREERNEK